MNGKPTAESEGDKKRPKSVYARENAARDIRSGFGESLDRAVGSTGKVLATLAGFGVFFVAAGYFVEWQRFRRGGLPPEEVVPLLPRDQIAAAGVRELAISALFIALSLGLLGFVLVKVAKWTDGRSCWLWRKVNAALSREAGFPTAVIAIFTLLLVPFDFFGLLVVVIVAGLLFYGLRLVREFLEAGDGAHFPLWRLTLAVALATFVLSVARQAEFPERRPDAVVMLVDGDEVKGEYLASDSAKVLLREKATSDSVQCELTKEKCVVRCDHRRLCIRECRLDRQRCDRPRLIVVPAGEVKEVHVTQSPWLLRQNSSLLDHIIDPFAPSFEFRCIPPECRWEGEVRVGLSSYL
ncbi:MAG TPA: hypothetical protein VF085_09495 [Solirubrobacterales bacterium]